MKDNSKLSAIRDEHADFKDEMARLRQLRGKVKMRYVLNFLRCEVIACKFICSTLMHRHYIVTAVLILPQLEKLVPTSGHVVIRRDLLPELEFIFSCIVFLALPHFKSSKDLCLTAYSYRQSWVDGKPPEKIVVPKYDGLNSYLPDPSHN